MQSGKQSEPFPPLLPVLSASPDPQGLPHGSLCLGQHTEAGGTQQSRGRDLG